MPSSVSRSLRDCTKEELLDVIQTLLTDAEARSEAFETLQRQLTAVRDCTCRRCPACATILFVKASPPPVRIPPQYVSGPWRKP